MTQTFEIGIVCAGAISGGAYQAGVLDFLLEALEQWYQAKGNADQRLVPPHEVRIKVISGASAGGMSAAIFASMLGDAPVHDIVPAPGIFSGNRLYDAWVASIDISELCKTDDLNANKSAAVTSLLNSTIIDTIATTALNKPYGALRPRYFSHPLQVSLSIANLSGVPHVIEIVTSTDPPGTKGLNLREHADYREFYLTTSGQVGVGTPLAPNNQIGWQVLNETAKATGAFPIGLSPRVTNRDLADYNFRTWCVPNSSCEQVGDKCSIPQVIPPSWPALASNNYSCLTVDGGTMNNTPTEIARVRLLGAACESLEPDGEKASQGLLLVVPFPAFSSPIQTTFDPGVNKANLSLFSVAGQLVSAWLEQVRFKTEELVLAANEAIYSEFLIGPSGGATVMPIGSPDHIDICGATLSGFGAFLFLDFRDHDYQLGRRNCQRFLSRSFALPSGNPLFVDWSEEQRNLYAVPDDPTHLPIIPLLGSAKDIVLQPDWPRRTAQQVSSLRGPISKRVSAVAQRLADSLPNFALKWLAKAVLQFGGASKLTDFVMQKIQDDLQRHDLISG